MSNYLKLLSFLKGHLRIFVIAAATMFVASFFEVFQISMLVPLIDPVFNKRKIVIGNEHIPDFIRALIDKINSMEPTHLFQTIIIIFAVAFIIKNILIYAYQYLMSAVGQRVMRDIRYQLYKKIQSLSLDYFSEKRTGELVSRITHDVNLIENAVSYAVTDLFRQTFMMIWWIATAFFIDPKSALVIFLIFPIIAIPMSNIGRFLKKIAKGIQEKMADISSLLLETISGVKVVKAFCNEDYEIERYRQRNHEYYKLRMKAIRRLILISPLTELIGGVFGVAMMIWFGRRILAGELSLGPFILFFGAIMSLISPIKKLSNVNALVQQGLAANTRIYEILDMDATVREKQDAKEIGELQKSIHIRNVNFHYYEETGLVLKDINLEIKKGELVAVVGPTGTGKTSLVNLIPRFYDPSSGSVLFDRVDLHDVSFRSLRQQIGYVTQETILFNDTVRANITYGKQDATDAEVEQAAKRAYAYRFIEKMPLKFNTMIGDLGFRLSGGEKQRIAIARAVLKNPPILILDEATSALDSESEKFVQEALDELMEGRTVVAIAHRLSTVLKADKIVVLESGRIVGLGRHEELLKNCPLYQRLHSMQFQV